MIFSPVANLSQRGKTATYIGFSGFTNDASSYSASTITDVGFYAIAVQWESTVGRSLSSLTVNGSAATLFNNSGDNLGATIAYITTTQPAIDIVATFSGNVVRSGIALWRIDGIGSNTPVATNGEGSSSTTVLTTIVGDYFPYKDGVGIGIVTNANQAAAVDWSAASNQPGRVVPITENYDVDTESLVDFSGANFYMADGNNVTITAQMNTTAAARLTCLVWN